MNERVLVSKRILAINSLGTAFARLLNAVIAFWLLQYLLNRVTPDEYRIIPTVSSLMLFVPIITTLFTAGLSRYATEAYARHDDERIQNITTTMMCLLTPVAGVMILVGVVLVWNVDLLLNITAAYTPQARVVLALMLGDFILTMSLSPLLVGMYVRQKFVFTSLIDVLVALVRVVLLFALLYGIGTSVVWVVVSNVAAHFVGLIFRLTISMRLVPALRLRRGGFRWEIAKEIAAYNGWSLFNQFATFVQRAFDPLLLTHLAGATGVNTFHVGATMDRQIRDLYTATTSPIAPILTTLHATDQQSRLRNSFVRGGRISLWLVLLAAAPFVVFHDEVMQLYLGKAFQLYPDSGKVMALLMGVYFTLFPRVMLHKILYASAIMRTITLINAAAQAVNMLVTLWLVWWLQMGAVGSAAASLITLTVANLFVYWPLSIRMLKLPAMTFIKDTVLRGTAPAIAGMAFCWMLGTHQAPETWVRFGTYSLLSVAVQLIVLYLFCMTAADKADLKRVVAYRFGSLNFTSPGIKP